jgi:hypothetical protein
MPFERFVALLRRELNPNPLEKRIPHLGQIQIVHRLASARFGHVLAMR